MDYKLAPELRLWNNGRITRMRSAEFLNQSCCQTEPDRIRLKVCWESDTVVKDICLRLEFSKSDGTKIGTACGFGIDKGEYRQNGEATVVLDASSLVSGRYETIINLFTVNEFGSHKNLDCVRGPDIELVGGRSDIVWDTRRWGSVRFPDMVTE